MGQIDQQLPGVPVYASSGVLERRPGGAIAAAPNVVRALSPMPPLNRLPARATRFLQRLSPRGAGRPDVLYGYEAMRVVLDAIRAGGPDRERVRRAGTRLRARRSPLGRYVLRATGDLEGGRFALWALRDGRFEFVRMVE
jgi:ABC-type branched-subunit amino acid transport system substrate-binding protein